MDSPMDIPAAEAAKLVSREVMEDGKARKVAVKADEVFACRLRDQALTVITTDGQKLNGVYAGKKA